jgi:D-cysteine desulfhydrase family pyridoxal phosphate-dependent enzyme
MNSIEKLETILSDKQKLNLSILPTRIHYLENISGYFSRTIYCMRDDLTGFGFGGNKTRKLDYLMYEAKAKGADCIVTFGSKQSNWCRITAAAGSVCGIEVHLILEGEKPEALTGNVVLDSLLGGQCSCFIEDSDEFVVSYALDYARKLEDQGRRPYFLPVGGSIPTGTLGYINAFLEILQFCRARSVDFDRIVVASGSAGTQAGLVAGQAVSGWKGQISGISVGRKRKEQEEMVYGLARDTLKDLNTGTEIERSSVKVEDAYFGDAYRSNTVEAGNAIRLFAGLEGIFLDEVYTGKAAAGLAGMIKKGEVSDNESILFIHTGGAVQLFE